MSHCPFCQIIEGNLEASVIYEDDVCLAIVPLHAPYPESAVVFPKEHIDHFTDLPKDLANHVMGVGFEIGQKIMSMYSPGRVGMGVHGYGVAHAHFNVFPQNHPYDVVFRKMAYVKEGEVRFGFKNLPVPSREKMDEIAATLKIEK
ncbi:HIT family hydrolase [Alcanivorax sp. HI0033]|uniref:HIT family protein n=1 Tax=unclassified Alcanivorax TaxID=2638842 RepID=UPI0007BAC377|nr:MULTISPECIES: HIT family protein [unclassified Alcanivorax]KZX79788.1 HIT family hydrolase [Alcanivorax sp. HI0013]KZX80120.1 HIT family hydrolase [Alcanivorax sp. HI0011]KZY19278.1 HIT family hydrolase [Alcanivorax sp. HI0035]KZX61063.1 HIT family hydrolase [Alcanivorax sp. HI0003]KZX66456.1 HIT family hydrolase [Alcanivorax sp. HI0007]